ncbi:MAG TPA: alpha/beta fold hydrolase, partial [Burkholderiales bacterium]|nr:alpha/beta fold hydrolase [Burkholderiales bacterium]
FHGQIVPLNGVGYRVEGRGNRWVTLVTGIANDLTMWDGQMPLLEPRCKVLRYDLRGHGGTWSTAGEYTIDLLVQDLVDLLDSQKIQRTSLVGLGLGGAIAQAFAIRHPGRVDRLMPCCCRAQMVPDFAAMWHKLRDTVRQNGLESIVEQTVQRWFSEDFKAAHPEVLDKVRAMIRRTTFEGYMGVTAAFLGLAEEARLAEIKAPTLYVSGADDKLGGPPPLMAGLAAKVPGARHVSVPKAAHIANIQNPEGFNRVLEDFLK